MAEHPSASQPPSQRRAERSNEARPRVVIVGSGFGGLFAAEALKHAPVDVTVIGETSHHLFQPLLYQVATGILSEGEIAPATREVLADQANAHVILGTVTDIDLAARSVTSNALNHELTTYYDQLIVAAGAGQSYFGNDQFAAFAPGLKSIDDALELRARIFDAFELAEVTIDPVAERRLMTFVIVGAGPTGVEMAGQVAELAHRALTKEYRRINPASARILLIEGGKQVLAPFGPKLGAKAAAKLEALGVQVLLGAMVTDVDADGVTIKHADGHTERIEAATKVWSAGVSGSPLGRTLAEQSGATLDRAGRVQVLPDLTLPGHPEVHVVGDMAAVEGVPGVAQGAIQGGRYAAEAIAREASGRPPQGPFRYFDKGSMATISRFNAVAIVGRFHFFGFFAWVLWLVVHLFYIIGFKSRITTLLHWTVSFVGRARSERTVTKREVRLPVEPPATS